MVEWSKKMVASYIYAPCHEYLSNNSYTVLYHLWPPNMGRKSIWRSFRNLLLYSTFKKLLGIFETQVGDLWL